VVITYFQDCQWSADILFALSAEVKTSSDPSLGAERWTAGGQDVLDPL
jgi:hypothetical protein